MQDVRTWIEIDRSALHHNVEQFLKLIGKRTRFLAVVKSNAYGHGLWHVAKALLALHSFSEGGWFGVDSIVEGLRLRKEGIKNPILVLGATLPSRLSDAAGKDITVAVSTFEMLRAIARRKKRPSFHIKIDTGMHRHGFLPPQTHKLIKLINSLNLKPEGIFTHFATANSLKNAAYTRRQFRTFKGVINDFKTAGFHTMIRHAASTGGTLYYPETRLDMVRIGMGMYGYLPTEIKDKRQKIKRQILKPVLMWKTIVGEVKEIPKGSYVGYYITERVRRKTTLAVLPVGYWHGFDCGLSQIGEVLIRGRRAKVLGRVSMDIIIVDVTDIPKVGTGDEAILIGRKGKESIWAPEIAAKIDTTQYEILTRINPLIRRIVM
ncbi:MAG: alanine racemase [Candidatus Sungbacteria bacterium RIFCSPHIGHO2_02_FULL_47_11]|uniref:Alanine racemase n=1 Tax=Candidatus Sungbacteria bacterium RIFCSPHIGHO2_02_FULL_47_11 TaxID=1802270 RepID=A0A1G2KFL4_9BACT|nr:MAG: alanine racemase [Candidatus Sungbacteria bacterium RIFCSPHIGHO2_02_FULL_47_11]